MSNCWANKKKIRPKVWDVQQGQETLFYCDIVLFKHLFYSNICYRQFGDCSPVQLVVLVERSCWRAKPQSKPKPESFSFPSGPAGPLTVMCDLCRRNRTVHADLWNFLKQWRRHFWWKPLSGGEVNLQWNESVRVCVCASLSLSLS